MNAAFFLEVKNEYSEHLSDILTPCIYEGLLSIYNKSVNMAEQAKSDKVLLIFQKLLLEVNNWNQIRIEEESNRIKQVSNTSEYLDDLVRAVIKSNIILLSYSNTISNLIGQTFYNSLATSALIHRCYTECAKDAHNHPFLFSHDMEPLDMKRNQIIIYQNIRAAICRAIRKTLPLSMILKEYLTNTMNIIQEPGKVELIGAPPKEIVIPAIPEQQKIDPKVEKEVMNMIQSEGTKSKQQQIQDIMKIDKILTSVENRVMADLAPKHASSKNPENALFNLKADASESRKSVSGTTLSARPMPSKMFEASERVDPTKIELIEDYGPQMGGAKKRGNK